MRTLFICCGIPYPLNSGGRMRVYHVLKALAEVSEVTFVCAIPGGRETPELDALRPFCKETFLFPVESFVWHRKASLPRPVFWMKTVLEFLHPTEPVLLQVTKSVEGRNLVEKLTARYFDLVWVERLSLLNLLPPSLRAQVIIDLDNLHHRQLGWELRHCGPRLATPLEWLEYVKLRRVERGLPRRPVGLVVCSLLDKQALGGGPRVWVVPNGVDLPPAEAGSGNGRLKDPADPVFVLVGSMDYRPNIDAAVWFVTRTLPLIRQEVPTARLFIVGKDPDAALWQLHDEKTVIVTGTVPDVAPYLAQAAVAVAPIRFGGGTRLKILEAMAHSRPVVATTMGAEGLDVESGKHLLLADSPANFARACVRLLREKLLRQKLIREGFELVRRQYQWSTVERRVQEIVTGPKP